MMASEVQNDVDENLMKWATVDTVEDNALYSAYRRSYVKLLKARRKKVEFLRQLEKGGRAKKQIARHEGYH